MNRYYLKIHKKNFYIRKYAFFLRFFIKKYSKSFFERSDISFLAIEKFLYLYTYRLTLIYKFFLIKKKKKILKNV